MNECDVDAIVEIASDEEQFEIHSKPGGLLEKCSMEGVLSAAKILSREGDTKVLKRLEKHFPNFFPPLDRSVLREVIEYDS